MKANTKWGDGSFAEKLRKLIKKGKVSKATYLHQKHVEKHGKSLWNPGYMYIQGCGPSRDAFGNSTGL